MPRAASIAMVTVLTVAIGTAGALGTAHALRPATRLASGLASPSPSVLPSPTPTQPSPTPPAPLPGHAQLVAPSTTVVWALMDYQALFLSTDQGNSWAKRSVPAPPGGIRPLVSFIDDREGWLLAPGVPATECEEASAHLWHTTDGAATWQQLNVGGIDKQQCKDGVWFVDAKHGFISASDPNHRPTIYRTSDGGATWTASTLADPPDFKSSAGGFELSVSWIRSFGRALYMEASDRQTDPTTSHQYVFTSADGASWAWKMKVPPREPVMVTESRLLLLTGPDAPQESTNGGQQWHPFTTDLDLDSHEFGGTEIVFADAEVGYETGDGLLQRTSDGGAQWVRIHVPGIGSQTSPSPIPMPTDAVLSAPSTNVVWALIASTHLFRSTDQGETWAERQWVPYSGGGGPPKISFVDDTRGWAVFPGVPATSCTDQGAELWQTSDGASSWHLDAQFTPAQCKDAMYFADAQHGWLATGDTVSPPMIWRTSDGGQTWSASPLYDPRLQPAAGPSPRVSTLKSFGSTVLAYAPPDVFRSIDGGVDWGLAAAVPAQPQESVVFVSPTRWLRITHQSESLDGGASWHRFTTDYEQAAGVEPTILFADANVGYATVRGEVQRTLDGGAQWEMIKFSWP